MHDIFLKLGFKLDKLIGRGGMAEVYLATQISLNRQVALKIMDANVGDDTFTERFLNEGRFIASLNHPNIITIYDIGVLEDGRYFISMEYVSGGDLEERLKSGPLTEDESINILQSLLSGLQLVHDKGIIHRDIKPANILFRHDGSLVLTDFGVAKELTGDIKLTQAGGALGSPAYMSPEQAQGKKLSSSSDIYSAGVVFLEMLSGENPYEGDSFVTTSMNHIQMDIPDLPGSYQRFQFVLDKMLAKDPYSRYDHIDELREDLTYCLQKKLPQTLPSLSQFKPKPLHLILVSLVIFVAILSSYFFYKPHKEEVNRYLTLAKKLENQGHLTTPKEKNAYWYYKKILNIDPDNTAAKTNLLRLKKYFMDKANSAYNNDQLMTPQEDNAYYYYQQAEKIAGKNTEIINGYQKITQRYIQLAYGALENLDASKANQYIDRGLVIEPKNQELLKLKEQAKTSKMPKRFFRSIGKTVKDISTDLID